MIPATFDRAVLGEDKDLIQIAADIEEISTRFAAIPFPVTVPNADSVWPGVSRRCKAMAYANLLRGEELLRFAVLAVNEGAIIVAQVLARALDETYSAVTFARIRIERAIAEGDPERLMDDLNRLVCGNRFMNKDDPDVPLTFNIQAMVDETDKYISRLAASLGKNAKGVWRDGYDFRSEFAHPSMGSFAVYQRPRGDVRVFDRRFGSEPGDLRHLLSGLRASSAGILSQAAALAELQDPPDDWSGFQHGP